MMQKLHIDFETRSRIDLRECGLARYATHPSTEILCMAWAVDDADPVVWWPINGRFAFPREFRRFALGNGTVHAQEVDFEYWMLREICGPRYGWPDFPLEVFRDTAAKCAFHNLPRGLGKVSKRLNLGHESKDAEGRKVMLKLTKPFRARKVNGEFIGGAFIDDPEMHARNREYCIQDVIAERAIDRILPDLPEKELEIWRAHTRINLRGVPIDRSICDGAVQILDQADKRACMELALLTDGEVSSPNQPKAIRAFTSKHGVDLPNLQVGTVTEALAGQLPSVVRDVLKLRADSSFASVKKLRKAACQVVEDGRLRQQHNYYAAGTGRFGGRGVQIQNLKREVCDASWLLAAIRKGDFGLLRMIVGDDAIRMLAKAVRPMICAPDGRKLVISDFAAIEMRVLQWVAGGRQALDEVRAFDRGEGADPYKMMACRIFGCKPEEVTKQMRQIGKVAVLGLGYGCGVDKFITIAKTMAGVDIDYEMAQKVVHVYRTVNTPVVNFWRGCERAAVRVLEQGGEQEVNNCCFKRWDDRDDRCWLMIELPCGRHLMYPEPRLEVGKYGKQVSYRDKIGRQKTYGAKLTENIVQAASRDLLCDALLRCLNAELDVIFHVHDEIVIEADVDDTESPKLLGEHMKAIEPWAEGCPIAVSVSEAQRYIK